MPRYNPADIEPRWQKYWEEHQTFKTPDLPRAGKVYVLDMFPYPSGDGLHVGHPEGYTATDIVCRFQRMQGKSVLHPMGFDAFGLPAEEHAIKTNTPPRVSTERNIATFRRQLKMLGFSYDWTRELATTDVEYFRWTQWIFLVLFDTWFDLQQQKGRPIAELPIPLEVKNQGEAAVRRFQDEHRLAYQAEALVNWCPALGTVLANEEVVDGKSERGGHPVRRIPLRQWMLRITAYADRLESDLEGVDWSEGIKLLQRNWIGRSTGAEVDFFIGAKGSFNTWKASRSKEPFPAKPAEDVLRIYTTRPDTLFGATYMVIAPEHPFVAKLTTAQQKQAVEAYCQKAAGKSDLERTELAKDKTGVFTGSYAINPVNGEQVPIWIADYVLISYGTGAIMAVPAHDERDFEFAKQFDLPIVCVVFPQVTTFGSLPSPEAQKDGVKTPAELHKEYVARITSGREVYTDDGIAMNSREYDNLPTHEFKERITNDLSLQGIGRKAVNYKLRDWLFSRQRFWGEPFPILHELDESGQPTGLLRAVDPQDLPVDLPKLDDFKPHGRPEPPLEKAPEDWLYVEIAGRRYKRETNTMPQWAGSCWYYLRFIDPKNSQAFVDPAKEKAWMPVDLYVGGAEHAVLHLLYSRFWHKVLFDRGYVSTPEPFQKLVNQGMILGEPQFYATAAAFEGEQAKLAERGIVGIRSEDDNGKISYILVNENAASPATANLREDQIEKRKGSFYVQGTDLPLTAKAEKMSKSRGNVVNPDKVVEEYGADALRLYEMFMGPLEATKPWSMSGVNGVRNFLDRVWRMVVEERSEEAVLHSSVEDSDPTDEQNRVLHKTIRDVTADTASMSFNTAIARMMEFVNYFTKQSVRPRACIEPFVLMLSPYAPHLAEELWRILGHTHTLAYEPWPKHDERLAKDAEVEIPVQIKGKLRAKIQAPADLGQKELEQLALNDEKVKELLAGQQVVKTIVVPGRLVNFVTK